MSPPISSRHQWNHHQNVDSQPWLQKVIRSKQVANSSQCKANLTRSETSCYHWQDVLVARWPKNNWTSVFFLVIINCLTIWVTNVAFEKLQWTWVLLVSWELARKCLMAHFSLIADEELKFILLKRPKISIVANYKINTKAAHNHFQRYSDVKVKG